MRFIKITSLTVILFASVVHSEKKIKLEDIEADNLKSEKDKDQEQVRPEKDPSQFEMLKYYKFDKPIHSNDQKYVHQYAVNEIPEFVSAPSGPQKPIALTNLVNQQAMVGYLPNLPLQFLIVPQYIDQGDESQSNVQALASFPAMEQSYYQPNPPQQNIPEIPAFSLIENNKQYSTRYNSPLTYFTNDHQRAATTASPQISVVTVAPTTLHPTAKPQITFQIPFSQYSSAVLAPAVVASKEHISPANLPYSNAIDDAVENEIEYSKPSAVNHYQINSDSGKYYMIKEEISTPKPPPLPEHPNSSLLLWRGHNQQQVPKVIPFRPLPKPIYPPNIYAKHIGPRPISTHQKRRPSSLIDSYIPSSVQVEYMKRGYSKDPMSAYEALSSSRHMYPHTVFPRQLERGFLPNQMYQTASGGITFGHFKRASKPLS